MLVRRGGGARGLKGRERTRLAKPVMVVIVGSQDTPCSLVYSSSQMLRLC